MAGLDQRQKLPCPLNICRVIGVRADGIYFRHPERVARLAARQRAAGQHAHADRTDAVVQGDIEELSEIIGRVVRRHRFAGGRHK